MLPLEWGRGRIHASGGPASSVLKVCSAGMTGIISGRTQCCCGSGCTHCGLLQLMRTLSLEEMWNPAPFLAESLHVLLILDSTAQPLHRQLWLASITHSQRASRGKDHASAARGFEWLACSPFSVKSLPALQQRRCCQPSQMLLQLLRATSRIKSSMSPLALQFHHLYGGQCQ